MMNGLSINELCCLFCCPPFPSNIVAKLAFLPPQPTYKLIINDQKEQVNIIPPIDSNNVDDHHQQQQQLNLNTTNPSTITTTSDSNSTTAAVTAATNDNNTNATANTATAAGNKSNNRRHTGSSRTGCNIYNTLFCKSKCLSSSSSSSSSNKAKQSQSLVYQSAQLQLTDKAEWQYGNRELDKLEVFLCRTSRGHKIACLFVRCTNQPKYTILFSHGNAVDLGQMSSFYYGLGCRLECNIFTYDYSGYGASDNSPTEKNLYSDIEAAWNALRTRYGISPSNIILYGQSIGTVPTVDLASKYDCAGVILHAPLMSGMRVAFNTQRTWCCDAFPSIDKVNKIQSLVLVIHGTDDEVIDLSHGIAIHEKCQKSVDPLWVEGAGHNDVEIYSQYVERLRRFINNEIPKHQLQIITTSEQRQQQQQQQQQASSQQQLKSNTSNSNIIITNTKSNATNEVNESSSLTHTQASNNNSNTNEQQQQKSLSSSTTQLNQPELAPTTPIIN